MAEFKLTKAHYDLALTLYLKLGNSPVNIARKVKIPISALDSLYENGIPPELPPIAPILRAHLDAKAAEKMARNAPLTQPVEAPAPEIRQTPPVVSDPAISPQPVVAPPVAAPPPQPVVVKVPAAPQPVVSLPGSAPNESSSLQMGDSAADLARALDNVHRDLAQALGRESRLVSGLREQAIGLASGATRSIQTFDAIISRLTDELTKKAQRGELLEERRAFSVLTKLARISRTAADAAERAIKLQRLIAGLPQTITADLSPDKPADRIADLSAITDRLEALQSARRARVIDVDAKPYKGEESGGD